MRVLFLTLCFASGLAAQAGDWTTVTALPNVEWTGLSAVQKQTALKLFREEACDCGCGRKIAQCRVEDSKCTISKGLAAKTIKGLKAGKSAAELKAMLAAGPGPRGILDEPVTLITDGAPMKGSANARITLVEFSDFECPYCSQAVLELEAIQKAFPNDVKLIYKQFPLAQIHSHALVAAQAALAAQAQGKFWPLHDRMFASRGKLSRENILTWAKELGCDMPKFTADMDSARTKAQIARDLEQGEEAGVEGTPTVFVNGKHYTGSLALEPFSQVLRGELIAQKK